MSYGDIMGSLLKAMTNKGRSRFEHMSNSPQLANECRRSIKNFLHSKQVRLLAIGLGMMVMTYANKHIFGARCSPVMMMAGLLYDRNLVANLPII